MHKELANKAQEVSWQTPVKNFLNQVKSSLLSKRTRKQRDSPNQEESIIQYSSAYMHETPPLVFSHHLPPQQVSAYQGSTSPSYSMYYYSGPYTAPQSTPSNPTNPVPYFFKNEQVKLPGIESLLKCDSDYIVPTKRVRQ